MILPHDADKGKPPKDSKQFGVFVAVMVTLIIIYIFSKG